MVGILCACFVADFALKMKNERKTNTALDDIEQYTRSTNLMLSNLYSSMKPLYYMSTVVGLAPFSITRRDKEQGKTVISIQTLWTRSVYTVICMLLLFVVIVTSLVARVTYSYPNSLKMALVPDALLWGTLSLCSFASLALSLIHRNKIVYILLRISELDSKLLKNQMNVYKTSSAIVTTVVATVTCSVIILIFSHVFWISERAGSRYVIFILPGYVVYLINSIMTMQFVSCVLFIWHRYRVLNSNFQAGDQIEGEEVFKSFTCQELHIMAEPTRHPNQVFTTKENETFFRETDQHTVVGKYPRKKAIILKLRKLRELHDMLYDTALVINSIYGLQMLLEIINTFIDTVVTLYYVIMYGLKDTGHVGGITHHGVIINASWSILFAIKFSAVMLSCHVASSEANSTVQILQKMLLSDSLTSRVESEVQAFLQQVVNQQLSFTACNFFCINLPTMSAIIGAITTYLVILLQSS